MTYTIPQINSAADTWQTLIDRLNVSLDIISNSAVTVSPAANGSQSVGNGYVVGTFGSQTLVAGTLRGGTVQTPANITFSSNISVTDGSTMSFANSTVNTSIWQGYLFVTSGTIDYAELTGDGLYYSGTTSDLWIGRSGLRTGNTSVNATINSSSVVLQGNGSVTVGANVVANTSALRVGNTTVNSFINSTAMTINGFLSVGGNVVANDSALLVGNSTVNTVLTSTGVQVGANVIANSTVVRVGNSTVYVIANSTSVQVGANVVANSTTVRVGNSTVYSLVNSTTIFTTGVIDGGTF